MRRAARVDENQADIVRVLRAFGVSVILLHQVGKGVPDILAGIRGKMALIEIKNGDKHWSLTPDQREFHSTWKGPRPIILDSVKAAETWAKKITAP